MNGNHKPLTKNTVYNWFSRYEEQPVENQSNLHFPEQKRTGQGNVTPLTQPAASTPLRPVFSSFVPSLNNKRLISNR